MVWPMPLPPQNPIISYRIKIQNSFTILVPAYPGYTGKEATGVCLLSIKHQ